jgi:threonine dehydratase
MARSVAAGERVDAGATWACSPDGTAVKQVGEETFRLAQRAASTRSSLVDTDAICAAIKDVFEDTRIDPRARRRTRRSPGIKA